MVEKDLLEDSSFVAPSAVDRAACENRAGLYCVRIRDSSVMRVEYRLVLEQRKHNILYIGQASRCLYKRMLQTELLGRNNGSFFRSVGALLGFRPSFGSLGHRRRSSNYTFDTADRIMIVRWLEENCIVNFVYFSPEKLNDIERDLIGKYQPILNLDHNPGRLQILDDLRAECRRIARGL